MPPCRSIKNINLATVFGCDQVAAIEADRNAQLVSITLRAITQEQRVSARSVGVVCAQSPAADHESICGGNTISPSAGGAVSLIMEFESRANNRHILTQALILAVNA